MSSINLDNFVNINIVEKRITSIDSTRDTVVLFNAITDSNLQPLPSGKDSYSSLEEMYLSSYIVEITDTVNYANKTNLYKYAYIYFRNGGAKLKIKTGTGTSSAVQKADIDSLERNEIIVASTSNDLDTIASLLTYTGGNQKILMYRTGVDISAKTNNLAVKRSTITGAEMSIAAYLSKINVYQRGSINDYSYTKELDALEETSLTDNDVKDAINHYYNIDIQLANSVRNIGGDMYNGLDLVNHYVLIILHQTLQDRLVSLLSEKLKNSSGISAIYSAIESELNRYVKSDYLTTDKIWLNPTLKIIDSYGVSHTIIEQNTPISLGYLVKILPLSSLSEEDKAAHKTPEIYIILATSYGIRVININGEVI